MKILSIFASIFLSTCAKKLVVENLAQHSSETHLIPARQIIESNKEFGYKQFDNLLNVLKLNTA